MTTGMNVRRFPFDWKHPIGYAIAILLQFKMVELTTSDTSFLVSFILAFILYTNAGVQDLICNLKNINKRAKKKHHRPGTMQQFSELLDFHWCLKRYWCLVVIIVMIHCWFPYFIIFFHSAIIDYSRIFEFLNTILFVLCTVELCFGMLMIQSDISHVILLLIKVHSPCLISISFESHFMNIQKKISRPTESIQWCWWTRFLRAFKLLKWFLLHVNLASGLAMRSVKLMMLSINSIGICFRSKSSAFYQHSFCIFSNRLN